MMRTGKSSMFRATRHSRHKGRRRKLFIETLESRRVLAAVFWDGGAGTLNWNDAANWSNNARPTAADDVTIPDLGTLGVVDQTIISNAAATAKSITSFESVSVTASSLTISGNVSGPGNITIAGGSVQLNSAWTNTSTLVLNSGSLNLGGTFTTPGIGNIVRSTPTSGSININGTLTNTANTLTLDGSAGGRGTWNVNSGGNIVDGDIATSNGAVLSLRGGTLSGGATITAGSIARVDSTTSFSNSFVLHGNLVQAPTAGINIGTITISGTGTVDLATGMAIFGTLTIGNGVWVNVAGNIGSGSATIINHGRIRQITASAVSVSGVSLVNESDGVIEIYSPTANLGTPFSIGTTSWTNKGVIKLDAGFLDLGGVFYTEDIGIIDRSGGIVGGLPTSGRVTITGTLNNVDKLTGAPATLSLDRSAGGLGSFNVGSGNPFFDIRTGNVVGGFVTTRGGAVLSAEWGTLSGLRVTTGSEVRVVGGNVTFTNNLELNGKLEIVNTSPSFAGTQSISGSGTINGARFSAGTLTIGHGITVNAVGFLGGGTSRIINRGRIRQTTAEAVDLSGGSFINESDGVIEINSLTANLNTPLSISAASWTNKGIIKLDAGFLDLGSVFYTEDIGIIDRSGGIVGGLPTSGRVTIAGTLNNVDKLTGAPATLSLDRSAGGYGSFNVGSGNPGFNIRTGNVVGGFVTTRGGAVLSAEWGTLSGLRVTTGSEVRVVGGNVTFANNLELNGTLELVNASPNFSGTQSISGTGTINGARLTAGTLTIGNGITVNAVGFLGGGTSRIINHGRIRQTTAVAVDLSGGTFINESDGVIEINSLTANFNTPLSISAASWANKGIIKLDAGFLDLGGVFYTEDIGIIDRSGGIVGGLPTRGKVTIAGTLNNFDKLTGAPATLLLDRSAGGYGSFSVGGNPSSNIRPGNVVGGFVTTRSGAVLTAELGTINSATITAGSTVNAFGIQFVNSLTLDGTLTQLGPMSFTGTQLLTGKGQVNLNGFFLSLSGVLTVDRNIVIEGVGGFSSTSGTLINRGTIRNASSTGTLSVQLSGFTNETDGVLEASGSTVNISSTSWTNRGTIRAKSGKTVTLSTRPTNYNSGTLTDGTWEVFTGGVIQFPATTPVTNNAASIRLDGPAPLIRTGTTDNALSGLVTNSGTLRLSGGHSRTQSLPLANSGTVIIDPLGTLTLPGAIYTQAAGSTLVNGTLTVPAGITVSGGVLGGSGDVRASVTNNSGTVAPGNSPGVLTIFGDYTQAAAATLLIELGGRSADAPVEFDRLRVTGIARLDGRVRAELINNFEPAPGDAFRVLDAAALVGRFAVHDFPYPGGSGRRLTETYDSSGLSLLAQIVPPLEFVAATTSAGIDTTLTPSQIVFDRFGNSYVTGSFSGTIDFDREHATPNDTLTATGQDGYVAAFDPLGILLWVHVLDGLQDTAGLGIDIDDGNTALSTDDRLWLTGYFGTSLALNASTVTGNPQQGFALQLNTLGQTITLDAIPTGASGLGRRIINSQTGNAIIVGDFTGTLTSTATTLVSAGGSDAFVMEFSPGSGVIRASRLGGTTNDHGNDIAQSNSGELWFVGDYASGTTGLANLTAVNGPGQSNSDATLLKLTSNGTGYVTQLVRTFGGAGSESSSAVVVDTDGNVVVGGAFELSIDFDNHPDTAFNLHSGGDQDAYVVKLAANGDFLWARSFGGYRDESLADLVVDATNNVFMTGEFHDRVDFDPQDETFILATSDQLSPEAYLSKLDADGQFLWAGPFGNRGNAVARGTGVDVSIAGIVAAVGTFRNTIDVDLTELISLRTYNSTVPSATAGYLALHDQKGIPDVAIAGLPLGSIAEGSTVNLSAAITDPDSIRFDYRWTFLRNDVVVASSKSAAPSFVFEDEGIYTVRLLVRDESGNRDASQATVIVNNAAPQVTTLARSAATISEGSSVTISGTFVDPGLLDSHTLVVDWNDGTYPQRLTLPPGSRLFSATHTFVDDDPTVTSSDLKNIRVRIQDNAEDLLAAKLSTAAVSRYDGTSSQALGDLVSGGTLSAATAMTIGPDGNIYASGSGGATNAVLKFSGVTGQLLQTFIAAGVQSTTRADDLAFGPDGNLYYLDATSNRVLRFDGRSGAFIDVFLTASSGLSDVRGMEFSPSGDLTIVNRGTNSILQTSGTTSSVLSAIVSLPGADDVAFGNDGELLVLVTQGTTSIQRFDGAGGFIGSLVTLPAFAGRGRLLSNAPDALFLSDANGSLQRVDLLTGNVTIIDSQNHSAIAALPAQGEGVVGVTVNNVAPVIEVTSEPSAVPGQFVLRALVSDVGSRDTFSYNWTVNGASIIGPTGGSTVTLSSATGTSFTLNLTVTDDDSTSSTYAVLIRIGTNNDDNLTVANPATGIRKVIVYGLNGNDTINASTVTTVPVELVGGTGNDALTGGSGNDVLIGNNPGDYALGYSGDTGNDTLVGNGGNDLLDGGLGNDVATGGLGNDRYIVVPGSDDVLVEGGFGSGIDTIDFSCAYFGITFDLSAQDTAQVVNPLAAAVDWHTVAIRGDFENLSGSDFVDALIGNSFDNRLVGGRGDDVINGRDGEDIIFGGDESDFLFNGDNGTGLIDSNDGNDALYGDGGDDQLAGGGGDDLLVGGRDDDVLLGGDGDDIIFSGDETETLFDGNDRADGGAGNDQITGGGGNDILAGGDDDDVLIGNGGDDIIFGGDETDTLFTGIDQTANDSTNGDDELYGGNGDDQLAGGGGDDLLVGGRDDDVLLGGDGDDIIFSGDETETLFDGNDRADGGSGNDQITGGGGNDILAGGDDDDVLVGNGGDDIIFGGDESDLYFNNDLQNQTNGTGDGDDELYGGGGDDQLTGGGGDDLLVGGRDDDVLLGGDGDDIIFSGDETETLFDGNDRADGGSGDDQITGGGGNDLLVGGADDDQLIGGGGDDIIFGGAGNDELTGGDGTDLFEGGSGHDRISESQNANITVTPTELRIGPSTENFFDIELLTLAGGAGPNILDASQFGGSAILIGLGGDDQLIGGPQRDVLFGGAGNDQLFGGLGDDTLDGGSGNDLVNGGDGNDTYLQIPGSDDVFVDSQGIDSLDFGAATQAIVLNLALATPQVLDASNNRLTLTGQFENARGTSYGDTILGNADRNILEGAGEVDVISGREGEDLIQGGFPQRIYLDFDTATGPGEKNYSIVERNLIEERLKRLFTPEFSITFTQNRPAVGRFSTIFINAGSLEENEVLIAGEARELDWRNYNPGSRASININGFLGKTNQPAATIANFVAMTTTLIAHELGHLLGLQHHDAFGPIGTGVFAGLSSRSFVRSESVPGSTASQPNSTSYQLKKSPVLLQAVTQSGNSSPNAFQLPNGSIFRDGVLVATFQIDVTGRTVITHADAQHPQVLSGILDASTGQLTVQWAQTPVSSSITITYHYDFTRPTFTGPDDAIETSRQIMASPSSVGTRVADTLGENYFGERSLLKLAFADAGNSWQESELSLTGAPANIGGVARQLGTLPALVVPNLLPIGSFNYGAQLQVEAANIVGSIGLVNGRSENDVYAFQANAGESVTIELLSESIRQRIFDDIDSVITLVDASGNPVDYYGAAAVNDDGITNRDSLLLDVRVVTTGTYFIIVDTFARSSASDTDTGQYELFIYTVTTSPTLRQGGLGDDLRGDDGADILIGSSADDRYAGIVGVDQFIGLSPFDQIVTPNQAQVAFDDVLIVGENQSATVNVLANDFVANTEGNLALISVQVQSITGVPISQLTTAQINRVSGGVVAFQPGTDFDWLVSGTEANVVVRYVIANQDGLTFSANLTIRVLGDNDAPVAQSTELAVDEDAGSLTIALPADDADGDDTPATLTYAVLTAPTFGTLSGLSSGTVIFTPGADVESLAVGEIRVVTFVYNATDRRGVTSNSAIVTITIQGKNDVPVATDVATAVDENSDAIRIPLFADDVDNDDSPATLRYTILSAPISGATISTTGNLLSFSPGSAFDYLTSGETAIAVLTYQVTDRNGATSVPATVSITVQGANDAPTAGNQTIAIGEDQPVVTSSLLVDDVDNDDSPSTLIYTVLNAPATGTVVITPAGTAVVSFGTAFDDLALSDTRTVTFTYVATDRHASTSSIATVTIHVAGTNDAPTASSVALSLNENDSNVSITLVGDDVDLDDSPTTLTYSVRSQPALGSLSAVSGNVLSFSPGTSLDGLAVGETRLLTFTYQTVDRHGAISPPATVSLTVIGANDAPTAANVTGNVAEDAASVNLNLLGDDIDSDDSTTTLSFSLLSSPPLGTLGVVTGTVVNYAPGSAFHDLAVGETRQVLFTYQTQDRHGALSLPATVTITVTGANDLPTATNLTVNVDENGPSVGIGLIGDDIDSDDAPTSLTYTLLASPALGTLSNISGNLLTFSPGAAFDDLSVGSTSVQTFTYRTTDRYGAISSPATGTIVVRGINDLPVATDLVRSVSVGGAAITIPLIADDVDSDDSPSSLTYQLIGTPAAGSVVNNQNGTITYTPPTSRPGVSTVVLNYVAIDRHQGTSNSASVRIDLISTMNVAPSQLTVTNDHATEDSASKNGRVTLSGSFIDPDLADRHTIIVQWGDQPGTQSTIVLPVGARSFNLTHNYQPGGMFTIVVTVADQLGASLSSTTYSYIQGIGLVGRTLYIVGSREEDDVRLIATQNGTNLRARIEIDEDCDDDGRRRREGTYPLSAIDRIVTWLSDGDDSYDGMFQVMNTASPPTQIVFGGRGDDRIKAGEGLAALIGGAGDDRLTGGSGRNILIGGRGEDRLDGGRERDVLIGDSTLQEANLAAIDAALASWRLNDWPATLLQLGSIVDDRDQDRLFGRTTEDKIIRGEGDRLN